jgi:hypothetical protein
MSQSQHEKKPITLKTRTSKNATAPENPMWIIVSVIGNGKSKYFGDRTHCSQQIIHINTRTNTNGSEIEIQYLVVQYDSGGKQNVD